MKGGVAQERREETSLKGPILNEKFMFSNTESFKALLLKKHQKSWRPLWSQTHCYQAHSVEEVDDFSKPPRPR